MIRFIPFVVALAVVIYAVADWKRTPEESMPGGLSRPLWLLIIVLTVPTFAIGAFAWVIMRAILRAEARQRGEATEPSLVESMRFQFRSEQVRPGSLAPDDDPEFLRKLQRDVARQKAQERDLEHKKGGGGLVDHSSDVVDLNPSESQENQGENPFEKGSSEGC